MKLRALKGLQPASQEAAEKIVSPPYDVVNASETRELLGLGVCKFLAVSRADAILGPNSSDEEVHAASLEALKQLEKDGELSEPKEESLYVYELSTKTHTQRGVVGLVNIEDYASRVIRAHETTRKHKEDERAALAEAVGAHTGPVLLGYRRNSTVTEIVNRITKQEPMFKIDKTSVGIPKAQHSVWRASCEDTKAIIEEFGNNVATSYIADGHHRAASAARVGYDRRYLGGTQMERLSDWFPAVIFPSDELLSRPYYRIISGIENGLKNLDIPIEPCESRPEQDAPSGCVYACTRNGWFKLNIDGIELQEHVLFPSFGISDPRTDERVGFVGGISLQQLERQVEDTDSIAFAPAPVTMDQVMRIVDEGKTMPPKSTWFEPKLCSGFFVHTF